MVVCAEFFFGNLAAGARVNLLAVGVDVVENDANLEGVLKENTAGLFAQLVHKLALKLLFLLRCVFVNQSLHPSVVGHVAFHLPLLLLKLALVYSPYLMIGVSIDLLFFVLVGSLLADGDLGA